MSAPLPTSELASSLAGHSFAQVTGSAARSNSPKPYYQDDAVELWHADYREILPRLVGIDAVITDTVFGVNGGSGPANLRRGKAKYDIGHFEDTPEYVGEVCVPTIQWARDNAKRVAVTVGTLCLWMYPPADAFGCYYTPANPSRGKWGFNVCSPILYYGKDPYAARQPNGTTMTENAEKLGHPCPKPIRAWTWLVNRASKPGELVLDPFAGSGTTLLACKRNGRRAIGIEINERYCEIIARRLSQEMTLVPPNL